VSLQPSSAAPRAAKRAALARAVRAFAQVLPTAEAG
jgi:hypothetical protein